MKTILRNKLAIGALAAVAGLMGAARGDAAATGINPPVYGGEKTHQEIISHIYGDSFVANGNDFEGAGLLSAPRSMHALPRSSRRSATSTARPAGPSPRSLTCMAWAITSKAKQATSI